MKPSLEIFSTEGLKFFFINLHEFFDINTRGLEDLEASDDKQNLSIVFLDNKGAVSKKAIENINENENFIFVCSDFSIFQNFWGLFFCNFRICISIYFFNYTF